MTWFIISNYYIAELNINNSEVVKKIIIEILHLLAKIIRNNIYYESYANKEIL